MTCGEEAASRLDVEAGELFMIDSYHLFWDAMPALQNQLHVNLVIEGK